MSVGDRIKRARQRANLSQRQLARAIGVSNGTISLWESGNRMPNLEGMIRIAEVTFTDLSVIRTGKTAPTDLESSSANTAEELEMLKLMRLCSDRQKQNLLKLMRETVGIRRQVEHQGEPA